MLGHEFGVLPEPIAGALDLDDHCMMEQAIEQRRGDDRIAEHIAPNGTRANRRCRYAMAAQGGNSVQGPRPLPQPPNSGRPIVITSTSASRSGGISRGCSSTRGVGGLRAGCRRLVRGGGGGGGATAIGLTTSGGLAAGSSGIGAAGGSSSNHTSGPSNSSRADRGSG